MPHVFPSTRAQERYPLDTYPCSRCSDPNEGLPHLVDNGCEFYWHHQHDPPGFSARSGCARFGTDNAFVGSPPRAGTATSRYRGYGGKYDLRTPDQYEAASRAVEEDGADDAWLRKGL